MPAARMRVSHAMIGSTSKAELRDDEEIEARFRGSVAFCDKRLLQHVARDQRMAFRMSGNADCANAARLEQAGRENIEAGRKRDRPGWRDRRQ